MGIMKREKRVRHPSYARELGCILCKRDGMEIGEGDYDGEIRKRNGESNKWYFDFQLRVVDQSIYLYYLA